jgi:hypothetical protein
MAVKAKLSCHLIRLMGKKIELKMYDEFPVEPQKRQNLPLETTVGPRKSGPSG